MTCHTWISSVLCLLMHLIFMFHIFLFILLIFFSFIKQPTKQYFIMHHIMEDDNEDNVTFHFEYNHLLRT